MALWLKRESRKWQAGLNGIRGQECPRPDDALRSLANALERHLPEEIYGPEELWENGKMREDRNAADQAEQIIPAQF